MMTEGLFNKASHETLINFKKLCTCRGKKNNCMMQKFLSLFTIHLALIEKLITKRQKLI